MASKEMCGHKVLYDCGFKHKMIYRDSRYGECQDARFWYKYEFKHPEYFRILGKAVNDVLALKAYSVVFETGEILDRVIGERYFATGDTLKLLKNTFPMLRNFVEAAKESYEEMPRTLRPSFRDIEDPMDFLEDPERRYVELYIKDGTPTGRCAKDHFIVRFSTKATGSPSSYSFRIHFNRNGDIELVEGWLLSREWGYYFEGYIRDKEWIAYKTSTTSSQSFQRKGGSFFV